VLRPAQLDLSLIGHPLPWDLFTDSGVLVAGAGLVIADESHFLKLIGRPLFLKSDTGLAPGALPDRLAELARELERELSADGALDPRQLRRIAADLEALGQLDMDACLGYPRLVTLARPGVAHCLRVMFTALFLADQMDIEEGERAGLGVAALTMNLADLDLHDRLFSRPDPLTEAERAQLRAHPLRSVECLARAGVDEAAWLETVAQHHENMDGSGYPAGLSGAGIRLTARILRVADTYCAKITGRHYRAPRSGRFALEELFGREKGRLDSQIAILLLRRIGLYPPGTLVRLSNRESACVTRRGRGGALRFAVSFLDGRGRPLESPRERDLNHRSHQMRALLDPEPAWPKIDWKRLWGY